MGQAPPPAGPVGEDADPTKEKLLPRRGHLFRAKSRTRRRSLAIREKNISTIIEPVAGPQYRAYFMEKSGQSDSIWLRLARKLLDDCASARGFVYIKANGDVWPCPFMERNTPNVANVPFKEIPNRSEVFLNLRNRENPLKGSCGECKYRTICGGCRGRALAYYGEYLAEDPSCFLYPQSR